VLSYLRSETLSCLPVCALVLSSVAGTWHTANICWMEGWMEGGREMGGGVGGGGPPPPKMFGWMDEKGDEWLDGWVSG
jgi:hypothetical protein